MSRWLGLREQAARDDGVPCFAQHGFRRRRFAVELLRVGLEGERVFALGIADAEDEQAGAALRVGRGAAGAADSAEDRHFAAVFQQVVGGLTGVAEGREQPAEPLALLEDALAGAPFVRELAAKPAQGRGVRRRACGRTRLRPLRASVRGWSGCRRRRSRLDSGGCRTRSRCGCR